MAIGPKYRGRCIRKSPRVISRLRWVPCEGGGGDGMECEGGGCRRLRRRRQRKQRGASALAAPFGGRGTCSVASACLSVLSRSLGVGSGIPARPEATAIGIGVLDARLLPIELPNPLSCRGSRRCVSGPSPLPALCSHLLGGLGPGVLIGRETFPVRKGPLGRSSVLNDSCEMRLHQLKTPDCPWRGGRSVA